MHFIIIILDHPINPSIVFHKLISCANLFVLRVLNTYPRLGHGWFHRSVCYICLCFPPSISLVVTIQGRIQDFKLGGAHLKKSRRAEGGANIFRVFRVKNHDFTPKNHIFSNFRGGAPPPLNPPLQYTIW